MLYRIKNISSRAIEIRKFVLIIYIVQLVLGISVAFMSYLQFDSAIGNSLELNRLAKGFDRSIWSDMINEFPELIAQIQNQFFIVILIYLIVSVFLHAGLLGAIAKGKNSVTYFFIASKNYFLKFLGIALVSILKMIFVLAAIWMPFVNWMGNPLETFHSDKTFILTVIGLLVLSTILILMIWLWSVLSRYQMINGRSFITAMRSGWLILMRHFLRYFMIGVGLIVLHALVSWFYTWVVDDWGAETWFYLLALILLQQLFSIARIYLRVFGYLAMYSRSLEN